MLKCKDLHAEVKGKEILRGVSITVNPGEIHAIMGPNGAGKSTLAKVLGGHPFYEVSGGTVEFESENLLELDPSDRAARGLFVSFQYPVEIGGVTNKQFLMTSLNSQRKRRGEVELSDDEFAILLQEKMDLIQMGAAYMERNVNEGFSGGEKKRNEILQMAVLDPKMAVLDETDSGLDIDALRIVADGINNLMSQERGLILITHYQRLLDYVKPHFVHVMMDGKIVQSGGPELALKLEEEGYDWLR